MTEGTDSPRRDEAGFWEAVEALRRAERVAVMAHVNPDADAVGSVAGMVAGLRALGTGGLRTRTGEVVAALSDPVPQYARFLPGADGVQTALPPGPYDLLVCLDSADIERIGALFLEDVPRFEATSILNVDHHRTNPRYGTINYVDPAASSTSELVFRLLTTMVRVEGRSGFLPGPDPATIFGPDVATALLFGIVGDTGSFRNGATTPGSLEVAAQLIRWGSDIQAIAYHLFEAKTFAAARLWGKILSGIQLDPERRIVFAYLSQAMLREANVPVSETEGLVEYLRGVEEARVVMLLKENEDGTIRVSMRSRPSVDVAAIASQLGGGGHRQAAGCTVPGPFAAAQAALIAAFDSLQRPPVGHLAAGD